MPSTLGVTVAALACCGADCDARRSAPAASAASAARSNSSSAGALDTQVTS